MLVHSEHHAGQSTSPTLLDVSDNMLIVTQVAPYSDGPAGVHGVLGQAATGLRELAHLSGLSPVFVDDVRDISPDAVGGGACPRPLHHR